MSVEENKAFMRRYYEEIDAAANDKRGASVLDDFIAPNFVNHDPSPGFTPDLEGLKQAYDHFLAAQPDGYHVVEDIRLVQATAQCGRCRHLPRSEPLRHGPLP
jgi:hypothetical protein